MVNHELIHVCNYDITSQNMRLTEEKNDREPWINLCV